MTPTEEKIIAILLDNGLTRETSIHERSRLAEDLNMDSLDTLELSMSIEEEFDIELPEELMGTVSTVADVAKMVDERVYSPKQ